MSTPTESQREVLEKYLTAQRERQTLPKAAGGGCLVNLVKIVVILILGLAFVAGFDYVDAPWSWDLWGRPTLTGEWLGQFRLPEGQPGVAYLNLTHDHNATRDVREAYSIRNFPPFEGMPWGVLDRAVFRAIPYMVVRPLTVRMSRSPCKPKYPPFLTLRCTN